MATRVFWNNTDPDDPLARALQPPFDESLEERAVRIRQQEEAARVSKEIDEEIAVARKAYERRKRAIKILLLGAQPMAPTTGAYTHLQRVGQAKQSRERVPRSRVRRLFIIT